MQRLHIFLAMVAAGAGVGVTPPPVYNNDCERLIHTVAVDVAAKLNVAGAHLSTAGRAVMQRVHQCEGALSVLAGKVMDGVETAALFAHNGIDRVGNKTGQIAYTTTDKVVYFMKNNKWRILSYLLAWGVFFGASAALHGFHTMTLPLTIGFGAGFGFGAVVGLGVYLTPRLSKPHNSLWTWINTGMEKLDQNGTKQIVMAIAVALIMATAIQYPYAIGAALGVLVGNQLVTKVAHRKPLGPDPDLVLSQIDHLKRDLTNLQQQIGRLTTAIDLLGEQRATLAAAVAHTRARTTSATMDQVARLTEQMQSDLRALQTEKAHVERQIADTEARAAAVEEEKSSSSGSSDD